MSKLKRIHINQHHIRANAKDGTALPVITVKTYNSNDYAHEAKIMHDGEVVATIKYQPDDPLSCGARVWIETREEVILT